MNDVVSELVREMASCVAAARAAGLRLPAVVEFEPGALGRLRAVVRMVASGPGPVLVVANRSVSDAARRAAIQHAVGEPLEWREVRGEPACDTIHALAEVARNLQPRLVIGLGGGSAIDAAKAVAALVRNEGAVEEYLEGAQPRRVLDAAPVPVIAIPTTAGTGAEMTRNAVIGWPARRVKRSLRDDRLMPAAAVVDPQWTLELPVSPTLSSGLDALTQLMECCISRRAMPTTTGLALRALRWIRWALPAALERPHNLAARTAMAAAASVSGICLANAGLAMAHGIAAALGAVRPVPHGWVCGVLLPHTLRFNCAVAKSALAEVMGAWLGKPASVPRIVEEGLADLEEWYRRLGVAPDFRELRLTSAEIEEIAVGSLGRSMDGNPVPMTADSVRAFLHPLC
ncbi:MAG: iron-containing alcohol dehydrogenase [Kiritimatiellae bacterium]|nr:iron-containing alcohol dehydrogenase [Kiritimatiellia bacterium]